MSLTDEEVAEIAIPLTGWVVRNKEAKQAFTALMSHNDSDFIDACRRLAHHMWKSDSSPTNRIKILLDNLGSNDREHVLDRILESAANQVLASMNAAGEPPYATYTKKFHGLVRSMGLGKRGALELLDSVIAGRLSEKVTPSGVRHFVFNKKQVRSRLRVAYEAIFETDNATGWDKVMHFVKSAQLAFNYGAHASGGAGVAKEIYDEIQQKAGKDPEGWSDADIEADLRGIKWGLELKQQP